LFRYLFNFFYSIFAERGIAWWCSLVIAYVFNIGWYAAYEQIRTELMSWPYFSWLPAQISFWWLILPFLIWVIAALAHKETMQRLRVGHVVFEGPNIYYDVGQYNKEGNQVGKIDIAYLNIKNIPYNLLNCEAVNRAYGSVGIYDSKWQHVKTVDYLRWPQGDLPGYQNPPEKRFNHEWNFRTLYPDSSGNRLDLFLKDKKDSDAYILRGLSQVKPLWKDPELAIPPGHYKVLVKVTGYPIKTPARLWLALEVSGANSSIRVTPLPSTVENWHKARKIA